MWDKTYSNTKFAKYIFETEEVSISYYLTKILGTFTVSQYYSLFYKLSREGSKKKL